MDSAMTFCPECGHRLVRPDGNFCGECGHRLRGQDRAGLRPPAGAWEYGVVRDAALARVVWERLGTPFAQRTVVTAQQMAALTGSLTLVSPPVTSLDGLQHAVNLAELIVQAPERPAGAWWAPRGVVVDLRPVRGMTGLGSLTVSDQPGVVDLRPVGDVPALTHLTLDFVGVADLTPLARLGRLRVLRLRTLGDVADLRPLAELTELAELVLSVLPGVGDLSALASMAGLTRLELASLEGVRDLGPVGALTGLTDLRLMRLKGVSDLGPLAGLTGLRSLWMVVPSAVRDLTPVAGLAGLTDVTVLGLGDRPVAGAAQLAARTGVNVSGC